MKQWKKMISFLTITVVVGGTLIMPQSKIYGENIQLVGSMEVQQKVTKEVLTQKIATLKNKMAEANKKGLDTYREESTIYFAEFFIKCADWDRKNPKINEALFEGWWGLKGAGKKLAAELPDYEYSEINKMLDESLVEINKVISGKIKRKPVPKINWNAIERKDGNFVMNGNKVVFPFTYIWKPNEAYFNNDFLGNINQGYVDLGLLQDGSGAVNQSRVKWLNKATSQLGSYMLGHRMPSYLLKENPKLGEGASAYTSYDINNPLAKTYWTNIFKAIMPANKTGNRALGYTLANEPHWFSRTDNWACKSAYKEGTVSEYKMDAFREWLKQMYKNDIKALNTRWKTSFKDFNEVTLKVPLDPKLEGTAQWYEYITFHNKNTTEWFKFLHNGLKAEDSGAATQIKIISNYFAEKDRTSGIDVEALTELTDIIGDDASITKKGVTNKNEEAWEKKYAFNWVGCSMPYDFMSSVAPNKAHINTENHFLSTVHFRDINLTPKYVRATFWMAALQGLDANIIWYWTRNTDGSPTDKVYNPKTKAVDAGYAYSNNQQPRVMNAVSQTMMDLNAFSEEIAAFQVQKKPLRIYHSEATAITRSNHIDKENMLYENLFFEGLPVGFATENIINKQNNKDWQAIVIYDTDKVKDSEFKTVQEYIKNGGTVIIDEVSFKYNQYGGKRKEPLKQMGNGKLITVSNADAKKMAVESMKVITSKGYAPKLKLEEGAQLGNKVCMFREIPKDSKTRILTAVNMGKTTKKVSITSDELEIKEIINLQTGEKISNPITLESEGTLLVEVKLK